MTLDLQLELLFWLGWIGLCFLLSFVYIRIAKHFHIVDRPNDRSSHRKVTIRGGGIVLSLALLISIFLMIPFSFPLLVAFTVIGAVSFFDDLRGVSSWIRLSVHLLAVVLCLSIVPVEEAWIYYLIGGLLLVIIGTGVINIYNFMDGINGLNVLYTSVLTIFALYLDVLHRQAYFIVLASCLVMLYFNMRPQGKAIYFSGDVGSVSAGLYACLVVGYLCFYFQSPIYLLFLTVYLTDSIWTILIRAYRRENIFQAHRSHLYQLLTNELGWSHIIVALLYCILQIIVNIVVTINSETAFIDNYLLIIAVILGFSLLYQLARRVLVKTISDHQPDLT